MHMAPRVITAHNHYAECALPTSGIIAGCTQSNFFARVMLFMILQQVMEAVPSKVRTRSFVDDVSQAAHGSGKTVRRTFKKAGSALASALKSNKLRISTKFL